MYTVFSNSNAPRCEKYFTPNWGIACGNFYPINELPTRGNFACYIQSKQEYNCGLKTVIGSC